jgi:DUF4097 and DUF4098 domain-containing protein YvlB
MKRIQTIPIMDCCAHNNNEDPWDESTLSRFRPGWKRAAVAVRASLLVMLFAVLVLVLPYHLQAQSTLPPSEVLEGGSKKVIITLSKDNKRLAQEYLDLLKQLQVLTNSYSNYFAATQVEQVRDHLENLNLITTQLKEGTYLENLELLTIDIDKLQQTLELKETALKEANKKAYRLSHSLHQELGVIQQLIQEDVLLQLENNRESREQVKACLEAVTIALVEKDASDKSCIILTTNGDVDTILLSLDDFGEIPMVIHVPDVPEDLPIPKVPPITVIHNKEFIPRSVGTGVVREFADSIHVSSTSQPIYISNPIGDLEVTGWARKELMVLSTIELSADTRTKAREQTQQIALQVYPKDDRIHVELIVPNLTDPRTEIINCALEVKAPENNPLICRSSFGNVLIRRMHNDVMLTASYSQVEVDGIDGRTEIANSMGKVELSRITGPVKVTNSYSPIEISHSHGDMEVENSFSSIDISHCDGNVVIRNTGDVDIMRHSGTIQIENKNGQVEVTKLDGDLTIGNSFQSLSIEDIFGSADVKNANGNVTAKNVTGGFSAHNSFGHLYGDLLYGPVHLATQNGSIDVTLAEKLAGPSTIDASFATVKLSLSPHSDLLLTATTVGGNIQSYFPVQTEESGLTRTAQLSLGNARTSLTVSGNNSNIIIRKAE